MSRFKKVLSTVGLLMLSWLISCQAQADLEMQDARLTVFLNPAGSPFSFLQEDLSIMHGIDTDILRELQKRLGFEIRDNRMYPLEIGPALELKKKKEIDIYGGGVPFKSEYNRIFTHLPIYIKSSYGVMYSSKNHKEIKSTKDLKGLKIGVAEGASSAKFVEKFGATPVTITNLSYSVFQVANGELDGLIYDRIILNDFAKSMQHASLKVLDEEFGKEHCQYTFYISKLSPYRKALTYTLQDMINDGTVNRILKKWKVEVKKPVFKRRPPKKKVNKT